jgi:two-component system, chemotaxis family, protein-glutamate methylesterase/glutaminase
MRVLVVDDSVIFRTQISGVLAGVPHIEVVGTASNGKIALERLNQSSVDLVVLDMEMPVMDGMETLQEIKRQGFPVKVVIFSSQTTRGAEKALEALRFGAMDVVSKPSGEFQGLEGAQLAIRETLVPQILQFLGQPQKGDVTPVQEPRKGFESQALTQRKDLSLLGPQVVVIASSTGGPGALESIFSNLKGPFSKPVLIAQHMPAVFTAILAKRLSSLCGSPVREAVHGEPLDKACVYIAPGDFHMSLKKDGEGVRILLDQGPRRNSVRPAADYLFESAAEIFGRRCLGIVLTGMGEDGALGARQIYENGGGVLIQSQESCVVFGMPGAVFSNNTYDEVRDLNGIAHFLKKILN